MEIPYPTRSKFLETCLAAISSSRLALLAGEKISTTLAPGGNDGEFKVSIIKSKPGGFVTDWDYSGSKRFPTKIRTAAWALYKNKCFGQFDISHHEGILEIKKLPVGGAWVLYKELTRSQHTDGVRIDKAFHSVFNAPGTQYYVPRGKSRPLEVLFNGKSFKASYVHENRKKSNLDMESIRFSRELLQEFREVSPDLLGYFSIEMGENPRQFIFRLLDDLSNKDSRLFAKTYIAQSAPSIDPEELERVRLKYLKKYKAKKRTKISHRGHANYGDPVLKEQIKRHYHFACQLCETQLKKIGWKKGMPRSIEIFFLYADAHHIVPLGKDGLDHPNNILCVCPNCHRRLHTGEYEIGFSLEGPHCQNTISGKSIQITIKDGHALIHRTKL
jgi:predicted HNH restriction endonuclease